MGSGGVVFRDRIGGSIAVSRAFGDIEFKNFGLISTPHLSTTLLTPDDTFLIIACDGVKKKKNLLLYFFLNNLLK